jgi:enediyne biosynthesis protein E3
MGLAVTDALAPWRKTRLSAFIAGPAAAHLYMAHVGAGWAMARLPGPLRHGIALTDPLLRWLAVDGYGFHQAFFKTGTYVEGRRRPRLRMSWPDPSGYACRVFDQGLGRALWFVCGASAARIAAVIGGFADDRRGDLWAGVGLAATYAGGAGAGELEILLTEAAAHRPEVAQGAAFAAKARLRAGLATPHTGVAVGIFCGTSARDAAAATDEALRDLPPDGPVPAYEVWRRRISAGYRAAARDPNGSGRPRSE